MSALSPILARGTGQYIWHYDSFRLAGSRMSSMDQYQQVGPTRWAHDVDATLSQCQSHDVVATLNQRQRHDVVLTLNQRQ